MSGTGLQFGTVRGEDRFYIPVKARKNQSQQKQARRAKSDKNDSPDSSAKNKVMDSDNRNFNEPSEPSVTPSSNRERFLESTTPFIPAQYFSKVDLFFPIVFYSYFLFLDC